MARVIDVHTHFVPMTIPARQGGNPLWPSVELRGDDTAAVIVNGKVFRIIDSRSWDAERRLGDMHKDGVDLQVISPMPELLSHWFPAQDADALATHINEQIATFCARHPAHFAGIGMAPMQDVALAARRVSDLKAMGLRGVEIGSHINGVPLGDPSLHDFYAAAEDADLAVMVHALHPAGLERIGSRPEFAAVAAFPLETALAATSLLAHGIPEKFPRLRIMLSHGGGALPWILPRMRHAYGLGPPMSDLFARDPAEMARKFYYDTVVYDPLALRFLTDMIGRESIVLGSDYPFSIMQTQPAHFVEQGLDGAHAALSANAERLLRLT